MPQLASLRDAPPVQTTRWVRIAIPVLLIFVWLVGGSIGGPFFGKVDEVSTNDQSSFLPESADATQVAERLPEFLGDDSIPALVVATAEGDVSELSAGRDAGARGHHRRPRRRERGRLAGDPVRRRRGRADLRSDRHRRVAGDRRDGARDVQEELPEGMEAWVTGPAGFTADLVKGFTGIDGLLLGVALGAVFLILIIVYRSPLLPVLVLLTSVFALCVALLTVWWLAYAGIVVLNGQVQGILFILVIGAATDYALLYVARFREAIGPGLERWEATKTAWRGAFEPILASGGTVIAGLLCLLLSDLATNRALGPIASIGIVFSVLAALTFLPALLAIFGRAAFWPFAPKPGDTRHEIPDDLTVPVRASGRAPRASSPAARG